MATTIEECRQIVELVKETGLTYTMMETTVYSREFFFVKGMVETGQLGRLQFLRASHQQEMAGWPRLLGRSASHVVRHPLRRTRSGVSAESSGIRVLLWFRSN